jgi:hypothetical protein
MDKDALIRTLALVMLLPAASGSARMPGLTISEVWKQHASLDAQVIRVSGVVTRCQVLSCSLRENLSPSARTLGLGSSLMFDGAIQSRLGLPVVIEGWLNATRLHSRADRTSCDHGERDVEICLDRASELRELRMVSLR